MWSIEFTSGQTVPNVVISEQAREIPPAVWRYFEKYRFPDAREFPDRAANKTFQGNAYLATHVAYIVTGYGRHRLYISDSPSLHRYLRRNFYAVLEMGELDLVAEFVDLFRQYGCNETNDAQTRDGTRYLMELYKAAGNSWIKHTDADAASGLRGTSDDDTASNYNLVHKPWTGVAGVRARKFEPAAAGSYGAIVRAWLPPPK
jgi:hypothetical protein